MFPLLKESIGKVVHRLVALDMEETIFTLIGDQRAKHVEEQQYQHYKMLLFIMVDFAFSVKIFNQKRIASVIHFSQRVLVLGTLPPKLFQLYVALVTHQ